MQLILESETSVDLKSKMSLNEENVDKCASEIVTAVQNRNIANGDEESIKKCVSDIVTDVENGTNGKCIANGEITKDSNEALENKAEGNNVVENIEQVKESETNNTDNALEDCSESEISAHANNNVQTNDVDAIINPSENVNIKEEIDDEQTAVCGDIKTEVSEDIKIKEEITESNSIAIKTKLDPISELLSEHLELPETNDNDTNQIMIKTESPENTPVLEEKEITETDNIGIDTRDESIDLIRLDASLSNGEKLGESLNHETEKQELTIDDPKVEESLKTDDVIQMDVDTSVDLIDEKENNLIESTIPMVNTAEITESKDCDLKETDSKEEDRPPQPNTDSSDNDIVNLNDDKEKTDDLVNLETTSNLTKANDDISKEEDRPPQPNPDSSDNDIVNLDDDKEKTVHSVNLETTSNLTKANDDNPVIKCDDSTEVAKNTGTDDPMSIDDIIDLDESVPKASQDSKCEESKIEEDDTNKTSSQESKQIEPVLKLSNTLDILSDDEEEQVPKNTDTDNKCINIEDDDDVMLIDDDTSGNESKPDPIKEHDSEKQMESKPESPPESVKITEDVKSTDTADNVPETDALVPDTEVTETTVAPDITDKVEESKLETELKKPLIPENFLKTCKKNLADMTRDELEEFCVLKLVESILDRSNLSEIKNKLKTLTQNLEEYKKKAMMLSKQNRDLQVVFKSVQEDVKKCTDTPIVPLKITRSVGMQVLMTDKPDKRRRTGIGLPNANVNKQVRNPVAQGPRPQKPPAQQIPVPRLVPANSPAIKSPQQQVNTVKTTSPLPNGVKSVSPVQKAEKRAHNRVQSVTVDLTDDEPPAKVVNRTQGAVPPVRLVPSQNLLAPPRPTAVNSPRKVYIPISGPQGQNIRPGQTIMLKSVPSASTRQRVPPPHMVRMPQSVRMTRPQGLRHPAPLPECMKQYQPPNWKALPPAPDLKLAKVENGIVISWKIEGYQEDSYEEIASYQLYAYQETSSPPNTALWKKIGDVKALPLPMACTLTQFMAGYKYYFAVRAVDIRSRLGPFSLPGSILLLNKM